MKQEMIEFRGDPMAQLRNLPELKKKQLFLNQESIDIMNTYATPPMMIPEFFTENFDIAKIDGENRFLLLATAGISTTGEEYPETYFLFERQRKNQEFPYKILGFCSSLRQYISPKWGQKCYFKMKTEKIHTYRAIK